MLIFIFKAKILSVWCSRCVFRKRKAGTYQLQTYYGQTKQITKRKTTTNNVG